MEQAVDTFEHAGLTIRIYQDENTAGPRADYDNLGTMICFHQTYELGDKHSYNVDSFHGWADLMAQIQEDTGGAFILPIYLMDHSGLCVSTNPEDFRAWDSQGWDWGQIGFIYVSVDDARTEFGDLDFGERALACLQSEVAEYNMYLRGEVYGYEIVKKIKCPTCHETHEEDIDSCWGFYGLEYCITEAKADAEASVG